MVSYQTIQKNNNKEQGYSFTCVIYRLKEVFLFVPFLLIIIICHFSVVTFSNTTQNQCILTAFLNYICSLSNYNLQNGSSYFTLPDSSYFF